MPSNLQFLTPAIVEGLIKTLIAKISNSIATDEPIHFIVIIKKQSNEPPTVLLEKSFYGGAKDLSDDLISHANTAKEAALKLWNNNQHLNTGYTSLVNPTMVLSSYGKGGVLVVCVGVRPYLCNALAKGLAKNIPSLASLESSLADLEAQKRKFES